MQSPQNLVMKADLLALRAFKTGQENRAPADSLPALNRMPFYGK